MRSPRWSHPDDSYDHPINLLVTYTHITYWTLSMETPDYSSQEVARLKSENDTLRARLQVLQAEVARLRDKLINAWGTC
jgi:cell division protein FtsB